MYKKKASKTKSKRSKSLKSHLKQKASITKEAMKYGKSRGIHVKEELAPKTLSELKQQAGEYAESRGGLVAWCRHNVTNYDEILEYIVRRWGSVPLEVSNQLRVDAYPVIAAYMGDLEKQEKS